MSDARITKATLTQRGEVLVEGVDGAYRRASGGTDWARVNALSDDEIEAAAKDDPDAQPLDDAFWASAAVVLVPRKPKQHQGMRLDAEVLDWFKATGPGWQTRINAVLKSFVAAQKRQKHG